MISIEVLALALTGLSITASILYYSNVLRNQNKTRQVQYLMDIWKQWSKPEAQLVGMEVANMEFKDYDDYLSKYDSKTNPELAAKRFSLWASFDMIGYLLKLGHITSEMVYEQSGNSMLLHWLKWEPIIREIRVRRNAPDYMANFEYVANEIVKFRKKKGYPQLPDHKY